MEKFIFDLDRTLINGDFELEGKMLSRLFSSSEEADKVIPYKGYLIEEYEKTFPRYDVNTFREYLSFRTGVNISQEFINEWLRLGSCLDDKVIDGVGDTLEYLKSKDKKLVVLTNWFTDVQVERLRKNHLLEYFSEVYGGDYDLKPNFEAFTRACGDTSKRECIMIGDNFDKDIRGARMFGMNTLYFNPNASSSNKQMIKRMNEIKERF